MCGGLCACLGNGMGAHSKLDTTASWLISVDMHASPLSRLISVGRACMMSTERRASTISGITVGGDGREGRRRWRERERGREL